MELRELSELLGKAAMDASLNLAEASAAAARDVRELLYSLQVRYRADEHQWRRIEALAGKSAAADLFAAIACEANPYSLSTETYYASMIGGMLESGISAEVLLRAADTHRLDQLIYTYRVAKTLDLQEALQALCEAILHAADALEEIAKEAMAYRERQSWPRPPRRAPETARFSPVRRYWINYRARDKLPCRSRKSAAMSKSGR